MRINKTAYLVGFVAFHAIGAFLVNFLDFENDIKFALLGFMRSFPIIEGSLNQLIDQWGLIGYLGTLWVLVLSSLLSLFVGLILFFAAYLVSKVLFYSIPKSYDVEDMTDGYSVGQTAGVNICFISPEVAKTSQTEHRKSVVFDWPIRRTYFRLKGTENVSKDVEDPVDRLKLIGLGILKAHSDTPAALSSHHGGESLLNHTKNVVVNIRALSNDSLADVVAIFHDIGKVKSYKRKNNASGDWTMAFFNHSTMAFTVMNSLPEFHMLPDNDKNTLKDVLTYFYRDRLPVYLESNTRVLELMSALKKADSKSTWSSLTMNEQDSNGAGASDSMTYELIISSLAKLNINRSQSPGVPEGWFFQDENYLYINPNCWLDKIGEGVSKEVAAQLQVGLNIMNNADHAGYNTLTSKLEAMGIFVSKIQDVPGLNGLFDMNFGQITFKKIMAIAASDVQELIKPELVKSWGVFEHPVKKIRTSSY